MILLGIKLILLLNLSVMDRRQSNPSVVVGKVRTKLIDIVWKGTEGNSIG